MFNVPRLRLVIYTLLLTLGTLWLTYPTQQSALEQTPDTPSELQFSWSTTGTTLWTLSKTDAQQSIISSEQFLYQNETQSSQFTAPSVFIIEDTSIANIRAQFGESQQDSQIQFMDGVEVSLQQTASNEVVRLNSDNLLYNTQTQEFTTLAPVEIIFPQGILSGTGLQANLNSREFKLNANVKATFYPNDLATLDNKENQ